MARNKKRKQKNRRNTRRKNIIRPGQPGIFHCWARCVRRAFLFGVDPYTGNDYSHRRQWIEERIQLLVESFAIDVGFFATLSNHLHLVLRVTPGLIDRLDDHEVAQRWLRVYPGRRVLDGSRLEPSKEQIQALAGNTKRIKEIRKRLSSVSWFMSALSEYVARRANLEDKTDGSFWSKRFSRREITDESALLICGMYVDLNQIRAGQARTPETSYNTSAYLRIKCRQPDVDTRGSQDDGWLAPLELEPDHLGDIPSASGRRASDKGLLNMTLDEYLRILDWAGREERNEKGSIPKDLLPIFDRLQIVPEFFAAVVTEFPKRFRRIAGPVNDLVQRAQDDRQNSFHGISTAAKVFA